MDAGLNSCKPLPLNPQHNLPFGPAGAQVFKGFLGLLKIIDLVDHGFDLIGDYAFIYFSSLLAV